MRTKGTLRIAIAVSLLGSVSVVACEGAAPVDGGHADGGPARDAGRRDASAPIDAGDVGGRVPVFVAQGYAGRTAVSCDDGRTWVADRSMDDALRCFQDGLDCDHHPGRAKGIAFGRTHFVATFGWGSPGEVRRSADGAQWDVVLEGTTFGDVAAGPDAMVLGARGARRSTDDGAAWSEPIDPGVSGWNVRRAGYVPHDGGRWIVVFEDASPEVRLSSDGGASWWAPTSIPAACGHGAQNEGGIGYVGGAIVLVGSDGVACRSTDGGRTWTEHAVGGSVSSSDVVHAEGELLAWGNGRVLRTRDGATWSEAATSPAVTIGAVARSPEGTFVAVSGGWNRWYDAQRWYRSTDGVRWEELGPEAARRGHPIHRIVHGLAAPSEACPAR
jgi:hypothetical protein